MIPDGTTTQPGVTPGADKAGTPQTMSREEHEKAVQKAVLDARSAVLADVGRVRKEAADALARAQSATERLARMEKEREEAELAAARDDPEKLTAVQERQRRRQTEADLEVARTELSTHKTRLAEYETREAEATKMTRAQEIAARLNVDPARLTKLVKLTDGSPEAIEEVAKELPKVEDGKKPGFKPDSNSTVGGGVGWQEVRAAYIKNPYDPRVRSEYNRMRREQGR